MAWFFRRLILFALNTFLLIHLSVPFTGYHINKSQIDRSIRKQHHYWTHHTNPPFNWRAASTRFHYRPTVHPCNKSSAAGYGQRNTLFSGAAGLKGNCTCGDSWRTIHQEHEYSCDSQLSCPGSWALLVHKSIANDKSHKIRYQSKFIDNALQSSLFLGWWWLNPNNKLHRFTPNGISHSQILVSIRFSN